MKLTRIPGRTPVGLEEVAAARPHRLKTRNHCQSRFLERGCGEAFFSEKKGFFGEKGAGNSVNEGFGKGFSTERQFSEELRAIH